MNQMKSASEVAHSELQRLSAIAKARFGSFREAAPVAAVPLLVLGSMSASAITAPAAGSRPDHQELDAGCRWCARWYRHDQGGQHHHLSGHGALRNDR